MKTPPRLSIIISSYNHGAYIGQCLQSALAVPGAEVIAVDRGSQDDTLAQMRACPGLAKVISTLEYADHPQTPNEGYLRNKGLPYSTAPYVLFLDGDDFLYPEAVARLLATIERDAALGFVFADLDIGDATGRVFSHTTRLLPLRQLEGYLFSSLMAECYYIISAVIFSTAAVRAVGGFKETYQGSADYDLHLRVSSRYPARHCDLTVGYYRRHREALSQDAVFMKKNMILIMENIRRHPLEYQPAGLTRANWCDLYYQLGKAYAYCGRHAEARRTLLRAVPAWPRGPLAAWHLLLSLFNCSMLDVREWRKQLFPAKK